MFQVSSLRGKESLLSLVMKAEKTARYPQTQPVSARSMTAGDSSVTWQRGACTKGGWWPLGQRVTGLGKALFPRLGVPGGAWKSSDLPCASLALSPVTKVYAAMGNHDFHPKSQLPGKEHRIYNRTAELWRPWLSDASLPLFRAGLAPLDHV